MLIFEYNLEPGEVVVRGQPDVNLAKKTFGVNVEVVGQPSKWAGYPTNAVLTGTYDLALLQKIKPGARLKVCGGYNSPHAIGAFGSIFSLSIEPLPEPKKSLSSITAMSMMSIEPACGVPADDLSIRKLATDRFMAWEQKLDYQEIWLDRVVSGFLCAHPEHFELPNEAEDPHDNVWVRLSDAVDRAALDNPFLLGRPWIAPRPMVEALIGPGLARQLFKYAADVGKRVITERPEQALKSVKTDIAHSAQMGA